MTGVHWYLAASLGDGRDVKVVRSERGCGAHRSGVPIGGVRPRRAPVTSHCADPFPRGPDATSQAAYQSGKGLPGSRRPAGAVRCIDTAKTNDPDNRPEIQQALDHCLKAIGPRCRTQRDRAGPGPARLSW